MRLICFLLISADIHITAQKIGALINEKSESFKLCRVYCLCFLLSGIIFKFHRYLVVWLGRFGQHQDSNSARAYGK